MPEMMYGSAKTHPVGVNSSIDYEFFLIFVSIFILGIVSRVIYDQTLDQLVGIALPLDPQTGCPKRFLFTARDEQEIRKFMHYDKSTLVYIVMAIPMKQGIPPFILQLFGTNNKFTAVNTIHRWNHTIQQLNG